MEFVSPVVIGIIGFIILLVLLFLEMPVGIALILVSFFGIWAINGLPSALGIIGNSPYRTSVTYVWSLIPLFMLMGNFAYHSGMGTDLFKSSFKWLGHLRGGLSMTTIGASAGFGAVCGDNIAAAATMTSVCLPEMRKYKYDDSLSLGSIAAGGVLSFMIPPSLGFVLYGILANVSISDLFIAGILPGILTAFLYMVSAYIVCSIYPNMAPEGPKATWKERLISLKDLWGAMILVMIIFGGIYSGFVTPTEAGALAAFATLIIGLVRKRLNKEGLKTAILNSVDTAGMVFLTVIGAWVFAPFLTLTTIPSVLVDIMSNWSPVLILWFIILFFFVGGLFFESVTLMIITIPLFLPVWIAANFDLIWFGVVIMLIVVLGNITPPVGIVIYVLAGMVPDVSIWKIFKGVLPFIPAVIICMILVIIFPQIATFLLNGF